MTQRATAPKFFRLLKVLAVARETYHELQPTKIAAAEPGTRSPGALARFDQSLCEPMPQAA